ncbi:Nucleosome assembly protein 1-like 1-B [Orchesella cincta]|uniref:Nucleosome assembly protein 1-like 1-B n=1 Tax=Orchesella cincta TaxID=48709 RepID=A0A1D2MV75_ORCCI|nr:Nucleosome assembly protein 1-like 1-B [Orchesella cincta]
MSAPEETPPVAQMEIAVQDAGKAEGDVKNDVPTIKSPVKQLWNLKFGEGESESITHPPEVERRVKALKKIQVELAQVERNFFKEVHELEAKYHPLYTKFYERRLVITSGKYEPTDEECEASWETASETEVKNNESKAEAAGGEIKKEPTAEAPVSGIPEFWLHVLRNVDRLSEMIHSCDEPILKHLTDITVELMTEPMGFKLLFHFSPNEWFTNSVLTKTYEMKCEVDLQDPFGFEGPEIINCKGCTIDWKEGKNITVRVVEKKQKHKKSGALRLISKEEEVPSFFAFFKPPLLPEEGTEDEDVQMALTMDFEIGQYIREQIIPRAVLYFTGEAVDYETSDLDDDDDDDEDDDTSRTTGENEEEDEENDA